MQISAALVPLNALKTPVKGSARWTCSGASQIRALLFAVALAPLLACHHDSQSYYLPVALGSSSGDVRRVLGAPDESSKDRDDTRFTAEWYYTHGIFAIFERDQLNEIVLYNGKLVSAPGFLPYTSQILRGLRLTDSKERILATLGPPTKIEDDAVPEGVDPNAPVVWPKESRYYWRMPAYTVEIDFLNQAQKWSDELTLPKDTVKRIHVKR